MFKRLIASLVCFTFSFSNLQYVHAQDFSINQLPVPGTMVGVSRPFAPLVLKGLIVNPQKPLEFQFIVDTGRGPQDTASIKDQANQLVKYFLAGLTIPEGDLWVNLSPYEKDRMVPAALGQTDLGRDLLAQDYILKQLTASLIYPEKDLGKEFWSRVYAKAQQQFGTTNIPVNTFNKVWILPDQAQVFENVNAAYVTKSTLKVMLDEDYLALQKHSIASPLALRNDTHSIGANIVRQIILPEIEKEVNTGKNFAPLRQIYQALILAKWYKETIQNGLLDAVYTNKNKVAGVNLDDPTVKEQIYERYLKAYKKGAFNYIKENPTPDGQVVPRKYFSGGEVMAINLKRDGAMSAVKRDGAMLSVVVTLAVAVGAVWVQSRIQKSRLEKLRRTDPEVYDKLKLELSKIDQISYIEELFPEALELKREGYAFEVFSLAPPVPPQSYGELERRKREHSPSDWLYIRRGAKLSDQDMLQTPNPTPDAAMRGEGESYYHKTILLNMLLIALNGYFSRGNIAASNPRYHPDTNNHYIPQIPKGENLELALNKLSRLLNLSGINLKKYKDELGEVHHLYFDLDYNELTTYFRLDGSFWDVKNPMPVSKLTPETKNMIIKEMKAFLQRIWMENKPNATKQERDEAIAKIIDNIKEKFSLDVKTATGDKAELAENGGIDLNQINVLRNGKTVNVQFDPAQLNELMQGGFQGFTPVIINMTPISSPFQLLGINPAKQEVLAKV